MPSFALLSSFIALRIENINCLQARQLSCSSHNGTLVLPAPKLDVEPGSLITFLGVDRFSSLAQFAGHILDSQADWTTHSLAASLHALAYLSGPAEQRLALANVLLSTATADAPPAPQHGRHVQLAAVLDSLAQRGQRGAALAAELLCLRALTATQRSVIDRVIDNCHTSCGAAPSRACSAPDTCRLPLQLDGERCLLASQQSTSGGKFLGKRDRTPSGASAGPEAAGAQQALPGSHTREIEAQLHDRKRPRLGETAAGSHAQVPEADRSCSNDHADCREALALVEGILTGEDCLIETASWACSRSSQLQDAMVAVHPGVMAEVARTSFRACRAYLSILLKQPDESLQTVIAGILHMLRVGGRPAELTLLTLKAIHARSTLKLTSPADSCTDAVVSSEA